MKKNSILTSTIVALLICISLPIVGIAHGGRTDSSGGHKDNKNVSGLGSYHYHHGHEAHLHPGGVCPYDSSTSTVVETPEPSITVPVIEETTAAVSTPTKSTSKKKVRTQKYKMSFVTTTEKDVYIYSQPNTASAVTGLADKADTELRFIGTSSEFTQVIWWNNTKFVYGYVPNTSISSPVKLTKKVDINSSGTYKDIVNEFADAAPLDYSVDETPMKGQYYFLPTKGKTATVTIDGNAETFTIGTIIDIPASSSTVDVENATFWSALYAPTKALISYAYTL